MPLTITIEQKEYEEEEKMPSAKDLALKRKAMKMMAKMHGKKKPGKMGMPEEEYEDEDD
jgi:hypothetical protein